MTLAQAINATLADLMAAHPEALVFGQDVAVKGGVYGVTRGLRKRFGGFRVFDTLLDEQTILGTALGAALAGFVPIPEIQYLAYLHNAEDQLRGEAASLRFFSNGQYQNGMVVRVAGLAYQRGFGGHFHNDNSVAVLRDIPGLVLAVPSHPGRGARPAAHLLRLAQRGRPGLRLPRADRAATTPATSSRTATAAGRPPTSPPDAARATHPPGRGRPARRGPRRPPRHVRQRRPPEPAGRGDRSAERGVASTVLDLRWLAPLPDEALTDVARRLRRGPGRRRDPAQRRRLRGRRRGAGRRRVRRPASPASPAPTASSRSDRRPRPCSSARTTSWTRSRRSSPPRHRHRRSSGAPRTSTTTRRDRDLEDPVDAGSRPRRHRPDADPGRA